MLCELLSYSAKSSSSKQSTIVLLPSCHTISAGVCPKINLAASKALSSKNGAISWSLVLIPATSSATVIGSCGK
ncbi:hypothetical protein [Peptostreptococcus porci]|uniref:hypothetical protein n=1 Tax=Peptostreptococcus porci TaxID=2652282 RepID=UPI001F1F2FD6|nr:hypothetical protein [Peptostreptococcus porci]